MAFKLSADERKELMELEADFCLARDALSDRLSDLSVEFQERWDEKSERWQQSEASLEASDFITSLESASEETANFEIDFGDILED